MRALAKSIESAPQAGIPVATKAAYKQFDREAKPIGIADPSHDMTPIATAAANRIRTNRHVHQVGSWVFGDKAGKVFVLNEDSICLGPMLKNSPESLVGFYAGATKDGKRPKCPKVEQLFEDLREHFVNIGLVTDAHLYAAVRGVEG